MEDDSVAKKIQRKRKAGEVHARAAKERAQDVETLRAAYLQSKDSMVLQDILAKCRLMIKSHTQNARQGVGARQTGVGENGKPIMDIFDLGTDKRVSELDKSAGVEEIFDYIERMVKPPVEVAAKPKAE